MAFLDYEPKWRLVTRVLVLPPASEPAWRTICSEFCEEVARARCLLQGYPQAQLGAFWGRVWCNEPYVKRLSGCTWPSYPQAPTHRFGRIGRPKNAKSPIAGASLAGTLLHCRQRFAVPPPSKSKTGQSLGTLNLLLGLRTELPREATSGVLSRIVATPHKFAH